MLFHSWQFAVFFLIVYLAYLPLRTTRLRLPWLLAASYFFYGWWNPLYLLLIVYSTAIDYFAVLWMARSPRRRLGLVVSVINNLGLLATLKYGTFVTENMNALLAQLGASTRIPSPGFLLPVGISFYTFQSMSYTIDFYRGKIPREKDFVKFATFVSLFPQLVAGPIERAGGLLPQLERRREISPERVTDGLSLFAVGLFKKVALADHLSLYVDRVYGAPALFHGPALALATFAFSWQIYFDFSGYTDMARGVARMMGFDLMLNFRNPYLATGLGDFWSRWHISLSSWFKEYVYIPLGGNRGGRLRTYRNMALTMLLSGLWHGAAWTFVLWGAVHAVGRCLTRELEGTSFYRDRIPASVKRLFVFAFVTFAWIFFRAESLGDAYLIVGRLFTTGLADPQVPLIVLTLCLAVWAYQLFFESRLGRIAEMRPVKVAMMCCILIYLVLFASPSHEPFIYFQF